LSPKPNQAASTPAVIAGIVATSPVVATPPVASPSAPPGPIHKIALTSWEGIWYIVMCIPLGAAYLTKIPAKKALSDFGLTELTSAESSWYVVLCIFFGAGYFAKIPTTKALSELPQYRAAAQKNLGTSNH